MSGIQDESNDGTGQTAPTPSEMNTAVDPLSSALATDMPATDVVVGEHAEQSQAGQGDEEKEKSHRQYIAHATNQLRIKKLEISECEHLLAELAHDHVRMQEEAHHIEQDIRRVEGELQRRESIANKQEGVSKTAQYNMRAKDQELQARAEKTTALDQEIIRIKQEIAEKEQHSAMIKEESRGLTKQKEDLRRKIELAQSAEKSRFRDGHEKQVEIARWKYELVRKRAELVHKKNATADRFHSAEAIKRDVARMEEELRHMEENIRRGEAELRAMEITMHNEKAITARDQVEINKTDLALHKGSDEMVKLGREIERLRGEIAQRERSKTELKVESQEFIKGKEELRRQYELEHFAANLSSTQAKELGLHLERFKQEFLRKEKEMEKNKLEQKEAKQKLLFLQQDVAVLEAELRKG